MNKAISSKISKVWGVHTHNPSRFPEVVVVVVKYSNEIIDGFHDFAEMILSFEEHVGRTFDVCCVGTSYDECIAMVTIGFEFQLSACVLMLGEFATVVCCAEVLFQPSFLNVVSTLHAEWSTERTTEPDTAQTGRVLTRLVDTASLGSRLHQVCISQAKECLSTTSMY